MLSVVLPAYNEEKNIRLAVEKISDFLEKRKIDFEIIAVNDGSKDKTAEILKACGNRRKNLSIITHPRNFGYGAALRSGFGKARGDLIFFTDSDLQFAIEDLPVFLEEIKKYDFVVGYRKKRKDPFPRVLSARIFKMVSRLFFGVKVNDIDCAFKIFKKEVIKNLSLDSSGALINLEIFAKAKEKGYKFKEIPVRHFPREGGEQTGGNIGVILKALAGFFPLWIKTKLGRRTF